MIIYMQEYYSASIIYFYWHVTKKQMRTLTVWTPSYFIVAPAGKLPEDQSWWHLAVEILADHSWWHLAVKISALCSYLLLLSVFSLPFSNFLLTNMQFLFLHFFNLHIIQNREKQYGYLANFAFSMPATVAKKESVPDFFNSISSCLPVLSPNIIFKESMKRYSE